ncbi:MAG TPA: hypothetical protein VD794_03395, partial [Flavisolibacter sp.]|nr:hypothetical protein [Flavisolibacter sp.]
MRFEIPNRELSHQPSLSRNQTGRFNHSLKLHPLLSSTNESASSIFRFSAFAPHLLRQSAA